VGEEGEDKEVKLNYMKPEAASVHLLNLLILTKNLKKEMFML
jgi:hypothetical protein